MEADEGPSIFIIFVLVGGLVALAAFSLILAFINRRGANKKRPRPTAEKLEMHVQRGITTNSDLRLGDELDTLSSVFEARADVICPICRADFVLGQATRTCPECGVRHHNECWDMIRGCSSFGCEHASRER